MLMGVSDMIDLGASSGQISIIPDDTAMGGEVIIQTFGVIDVVRSHYWLYWFVVNIFSWC